MRIIHTGLTHLLAQVIDYIRNERNILDALHHPGIAQLHFTFQVGGLVTLFASNGNLNIWKDEIVVGSRCCCGWQEARVCVRPQFATTVYRNMCQIVPLQDADSLYMGLEYCPNGELYQQVEARGKLPLEDARQWAAEIVDILAYLREREVIHRCGR